MRRYLSSLSTSLPRDQRLFWLRVLAVLIILLFIYYVLYPRLMESNREGYLNYFIPYYNPGSIAIYDFYKKDGDYNNQTKKSFIYKPLRIGYDEDAEFMKQFGSMCVAKSFIQDVVYMKDQDEEAMLRDCNAGKLDIVNCSNPLVTNLYLSENLRNLRFICNTNKMYLYIITTRNSGIESLKDIEKVVMGKAGDGRPMTLAIDYKGSVADLFARDLMTALGYVADRDYTFVYSQDGSTEGAFETATQDRAKMAILSLPYKPPLFEKFCGAGKNIFFLPFEFYNREKYKTFFTDNFYYIQDIYDLNDVCMSYLPKKYGGKTYSTFSAQIPIVSYYNTMVCNADLSDDTTYQILRTFYENVPLFNRLPVFRKQPMYKTQLSAGPQNSLPLKPGSLKFYKEHGYITAEESESCIYFVGAPGGCTKKVLQDNGLMEGNKELDSIFRFR